MREENVIVLSEKNEQARKYLKLPFSCQLVYYGNNIVASVQEAYREIVKKYMESYEAYHCFETPNLHVLNEALLPHGQKICFMTILNGRTLQLSKNNLTTIFMKCLNHT